MEEIKNAPLVTENADEVWTIPISEDGSIQITDSTGAEQVWTIQDQSIESDSLFDFEAFVNSMLPDEPFDLDQRYFAQEGEWLNEVISDSIEQVVEHEINADQAEQTAQSE